MSWPNTPFRTMSDGSTFWDAALGNAIQSAINGISTGNASLLGAVLDGVGGAASTPIPGALTLSASAGGLTAPTPAYARGSLYKESGLFAAVSVSGGTTFVAGLNIASFVRNSTGVYTLTTNVAGSAIARMIGFGCLPGVTGFIEVIAGSTTTFVVSTFNTSSVLTDMSFNAFLFHV